MLVIEYIDKHKSKIKEKELGIDVNQIAYEIEEEPDPEDMAEMIEDNVLRLFLKRKGDIDKLELVSDNPEYGKIVQFGIKDEKLLLVHYDIKKGKDEFLKLLNLSTR